MQTSLDPSRWYHRIAAAFIFFTRLPLWRICQPPRQCYASVVEYWPLTGWLTAAFMAGTLYAASELMPYPIAVILAIVVRMLLTGALHEDGLSDFFDGFGGGGTDRQRILDIMKDSRVGSYGVLSLIAYMLLFFMALVSMPPFYAALTILAADPYAKMLASELVIIMPYARTAETAKSHTVYRRMGIPACIGLAVQGLLPMGAYIYYMYGLVDWQMLLFVPCLVMYFIYLLIWHRLRGYTGDCCGAMFLMVELAVYITCACYLGSNA